MIYVIIYLFAIIAANLSVAHFGPESSIINAFILIGLVISTRDKLHDMWGHHVARNMLGLIAIGGLISYLLNSEAKTIAIASFVAFVVSEVVDAIVYHINREKSYLERSNRSNVFSSALDSIIFPVVAFGGFPLAIILGQFIAKFVGGFLWSLLLDHLRRRNK